MTAARTAPHRRRRSRGLALVCGLALAALYLLAVRPLTGAAGAAQPLPDPPVPAVVAPPAQVPAPSESPSPPPPETFEVFVARDPFQQLVEVSETVDDASGTTPSPGASPGTTVTTPGGTTVTTPGGATVTTPGGTTVTTSPRATPSPTPTPSPSATPSPGATPPTVASPRPTPSGASPGAPDPDGGSTQVGATRVELIDVFDSNGSPTVSVAVNGTGYTVAEGAEFGDRFRLLDVSGTCATFLFGDSRFTLCEGESIRK